MYDTNNRYSILLTVLLTVRGGARQGANRPIILCFICSCMWLNDINYAFTLVLTSGLGHCNPITFCYTHQKVKDLAYRTSECYTDYKNQWLCM